MEHEDQPVLLGGFTTARSLDTWESIMVKDQFGHPVAQHRVPHEGFVHVCDYSGQCACAPHVIVVTFTCGELHSYISHNRIQSLEDDDWDDDEDEDGITAP